MNKKLRSISIPRNNGSMSLSKKILHKWISWTKKLLINYKSGVPSYTFYWEGI